MVGPDIAFGEQVGDTDGSDAVVRADDDLEGGKVVEKDLTAPAARRDDPPVAISHGDDRVQLVDPLGGCRADESQLGARASGEVVDVHRRDDPPFPSQSSALFRGRPAPDEPARCPARLLEGRPACTDIKSRPFVEASGVTVLDGPFHAEGNIATAGGCLASQYLATWVITRTLGEAAARGVLDYVAPVGENQETVERALHAVHAGESALR